MAINSGCGVPKGKVIQLHTVLCVKRQFSVGIQDLPKFFNIQRRVTHICLAKIACSDNQTKIAFKTIQNSSSIESQDTSEVSETIPVPVRNICVTSKNDDTTEAEIIWAAKVASGNHSLR